MFLKLSQIIKKLDFTGDGLEGGIKWIKKQKWAKKLNEDELQVTAN